MMFAVAFLGLILVGCASSQSAWDYSRMDADSYAQVAAGVDRLDDDGRRAVYRHVAAVADEVVPFDWRAAGVTLAIACRPAHGSACPIGMAYRSERTIVLSPHVRWLTVEALQVLVAHEFAHAWQWDRPWPAGSLIALADVWMPQGAPLSELEADCIAAVWGYVAPRNVGLAYWVCPAEALSAVAHESP